MTKEDPIGIFDSGVGGTSIWKEVHRLLPMEHTIYLADSINAPYGEKNRQEIIDLSIKNTEKLLEFGAKIVIVACNTATTNAIKTLRASYSIPFIGIEPAIKPAALYSQKKCIGILATKGTLSSELFAKTSDLYSQGTRVIEVIGHGLVQAIENGELQTAGVKKMLSELLEPMIEADIDYLVLGCSHYPYLIPALREILPPTVKIIDSGRAVAKQTRVILQSLDLLATAPQHAPQFFTNGRPEILKQLVNTPTQAYSVNYLNF